MRRARLCLPLLALAACQGPSPAEEIQPTTRNFEDIPIFQGCEDQCGSVCFSGADDCSAACNIDVGNGVCVPSTCGANVALPCDGHTADAPVGVPSGGGGNDSVQSLSWGQPTWQTSTDFGGTSDRAVDGNLDGAFWNGSVIQTQREDNPMWGVWIKRGRPKRISVYTRLDCCSDWLAGGHVWLRRASNDHTWDLVGTLSGAGGRQTIVVPNSNGRVVSDGVAIVLDGKARILTLAEVGVQGPAL
ncbi:MAG TPA: hypothetical protein VN914_03360 [Polyangia bacterium]|nr:hypothetical protein [Polyangia bacterium]